MSSDTNTTTLDDFGDDATPEDDSQTAPDQSHSRKPKWTPDGTARCECGAPVSKEVARVFGDETDTVPACASCHDTYDGRDAYATDSRALVNYLGGGDR